MTRGWLAFILLLIALFASMWATRDLTPQQQWELTRCL